MVEFPPDDAENMIEFRIAFGCHQPHAILNRYFGPKYTRRHPYIDRRLPLGDFFLKPWKWSSGRGRGR